MDKLNQYLERIENAACINPASSEEFINGVEIVVPIYNGFLAVKKCINSLLKYTSKSQVITILDDASTDKQLSQYLQQICEKNRHIKWVVRKTNHGYLANINLHLRGSKHAILLLNSDTEVTDGWLDEMMNVAVDPKVGVVCPLSNNATLLTLPDVDTEQIRSLKELSGYWFPIPTAVGFCMLIKPGLWQQIKGFDPYYDPGYGEECDFSMSVRQQNLQVACAPASYVFHQGSVSFKKQAHSLQRKHQHLLDLRWPQYQQEISQFIKNNPVQWIKQWLINQHTEKSRILHVVHGIENKGGVELFTRQLLQSFDDTFHHTVLVNTAGKDVYRPLSAEWPIEVIKLNMDAFDPDHVIFKLPADLYHFKLDVYFKDLLQWGGFAHVHFHSTVGIGTAVWPQICNFLGIPYGIFFHDHSGLCEIFSLSTTVNKQEVYCGKSYAEPDDQQCQQCIMGKTRKARLTTESYLDMRQKIWYENISKAKHLQFCSDYLLQMYKQLYEGINNKSLVVEPCFYPSQTGKSRCSKTEQVTVAFLGQFGVLKGAQLFIDLYHRMKSTNIQWQIIGGVDPVYQTQLEQTEISTYGSYEGSELSRLLSSVDLMVFTTQIPETYGITLTEAMIHGIPVVAPDIGAYSSRIKSNHNGLLYQANNLNSLVAAVEQLIEMQKGDKSCITQIEYVADNNQKTATLNDLYQSVITKKDNSSFSMSGREDCLLDPPKYNAYQVMQNWLEAPMTLEADVDWKPAPSQLNVIVIGQQKQAIQLTINNLNLHLSSPVITLLQDLKNTDFKLDLDSILVIQAGSLINENIGNWLVDFEQQQAVASLADFALHNHQQLIYAPQFMGSFSWQNTWINQANIAAMLLNPKLMKLQEKSELWTTELNFQKLVSYLYEFHNNEVVYFPFFSYTMADQLFASNWKNFSNSNKLSNKKDPKIIWILVETQLTGESLRLLKQQFKQQKWHQSMSVETHFFKSDDKSTVLQSLGLKNIDNNSECAVLVIADNVRLTHKNCLQKMYDSLYQSHVDVLTIPAAKPSSGNNLIAKKAGAANHFQGIGEIKDMRFSAKDCVVEYEWLDDDCWLFNTKAWKVSMDLYQHDVSLFTALKISSILQEQQLKIGIQSTAGLYKSRLPSTHLSDLELDLKSQRQQVIDARVHLPKISHYSKAFSARQGCQLDLKMTSFKTPKSLPRVVAYAQDDWASGFYRVKSPLNALAANNQISVHFLNNKGQKNPPTPYEIHRMQADVLLLHGFYADHQLAALNQYKNQLNFKIIISIDDLLTEIPAYNPFAKRTPKDIETRIRMACLLADTLIVSTEELAIKYKQLHQNIVVIPNRISKFIWPVEPTSKKSISNKRLRVGWAGAGQHAADLEWLSQVIKQTQSFCDWVFFGDKPAKVDLNDIEFHPPVDFLHYAEKLQTLNLDLAVAPLVDNAFNRAKSQLKLLEYGASGLPVVASDLPCYQNSPAMLIKNDVSGWVKKLKMLHEDRVALQQNGQLMQHWVHGNYWLEDHQHQWLAALHLV